MGSQASTVSEPTVDPLLHAVHTLSEVYVSITRRAQARSDEEGAAMCAHITEQLNQWLQVLEDHKQNLIRARDLASDAPEGRSNVVSAEPVIAPARTKSVARNREEKELLADAIKNNAMPKSRSRSAPQIVPGGASRSPAPKPLPPAAKAAAVQTPIIVRVKPAGRSGSSSRSRAPASGSRSRKRPSKEVAEAAEEESEGESGDDAAAAEIVVAPSPVDGDDEVELLEEGVVAKPASRTRSRSPKGLTPGAPQPSPRSRARKVARAEDDEDSAPVAAEEAPKNPEPEADAAPMEEDADQQDVPALKPISVVSRNCHLCKAENSPNACNSPGCDAFFCAGCSSVMTNLGLAVQCREHGK